MRTGLSVPALLRIAATRGDRTRYAIAKRCGLAQSTVLRLFAGQSAPTMTTLNRIATTYDVSVTDLLTDDVSQADTA